MPDHLAGERDIRATEMLATILHLAAQRRLLVLQGVPYTARAAGWPDLQICGPGAVAFRWLSMRRPRPPAQAMIETFRASGHNAAAWQPQDLLAGQVEAELDFLAGGGAIAPAERQCIACKRRFTPTSPKNRYCSHRCRNAVSNAARSHVRWRETSPLPYSHYPPDEG
jgi:hypothetical protein